MKKFYFVICLIFGIIANQSVIEAAHYYFYYDEKFKITYYIDSDYTGRYITIRKFVADKDQSKIKPGSFREDSTGIIGRYVDVGEFVKEKIQDRLISGLFKVRVISVWDPESVNKYKPRNQISKRDYYFYIGDGKSVFDNEKANPTIIKSYQGLKGTGLRCLKPTIQYNDGSYRYDDVLVKQYSYYNDTYCEKFLYKIYTEARKVYGIPNSREADNYIEYLKFKNYESRFKINSRNSVIFYKFYHSGDNLFNANHLIIDSIEGNINNFRCVTYYVISSANFRLDNLTDGYDYVKSGYIFKTDSSGIYFSNGSVDMEKLDHNCFNFDLVYSLYRTAINYLY